MTLGEKIKDCRLRAGLSQEELAERMGVSRQAVGKWETGQAAPGAEKLQRLSDLFGESMTPPASPAQDNPRPEADPAAVAQELFALSEREKAEKTAARRRMRRRNALSFLSVCAAYLLLYLLGRLIWCSAEELTVTGFLYAAKPSGAHSYLFGWLLSSRLFWCAAAVSALPALLGKRNFSLVTLAGFVLGFLLGLAFGPNPAGAALGQGDYGWAIWGAVFLVSCLAGGVVQRIWGKR